MTSSSGKWHSLMDSSEYSAYITDFESSVGIVGTGFWRAPEVLKALRNGRLKPETLTFTQQVDVYSYVMTCYEVITGRVPFENQRCEESCDVVLCGGRPSLPKDICPELKIIMRKCWHKDPCRRLGICRYC
ncbi:hypothetical protein KC19_7G018300 [Ceratodon purpureus]|uniref:Protein kinase domain-containing protein n=1 Tax=Ceratodon purpureus TaxID=3225 RepID=A0A8T0H587_CERPU|nr:hypothetical protein KC19_7G018300 [Ceratodon purpureus]